MRRWIRAAARLRGSPWQGRQTAFIVSSGRTGTHFLAGLLPHALGDVHACHEPYPDLLELGRAFQAGRVSLGKAARLIGEQRRDLLRRLPGGCAYVEANLHLSSLVPALRRARPRAPIVRVVRDGRDYVRSAFSKTTRGRGGGTALFMTPEDHRDRLSATDLPGDAYAERWASLDRFERLAWHWSRLDALAADALAGDPLATTIRYEDLFDAGRGPETVRRLIGFLGLEPRLRVSDAELAELLLEKADATESYDLPHWTEWPDELTEKFHAVAGAHLSRCGYAGG
ncbi:MAG: hypothetical protein QNK04_07145 [Myxococcota bacterium]|nr:hypothetical protein [Myxococcota bacterium]